MQTPRYEYSRSAILSTIKELASLSAPHSLIVRYAIKANPHKDIITMMQTYGVQFDASSSYEADYLLNMGIAGTTIAVSSQQSAHNLDELLQKGVRYTATSLHQIQAYIDSENSTNELAVRINPGTGSGHNNRTSTGGLNASFGIWHEYIPEVLQLVAANGMKVTTVHYHIGSGADPSVWAGTMDICLAMTELLPDAKTIDIGGGFKVHRFGDEKEANMQDVVDMMSQKIIEFEQKTGRKLTLEIEPGTYFIAHAGTLVATVDDIVDTGKNGHVFLRTNTGMNDFLRSSMYGSRHRIEIMNDSSETQDYIVVGHNCESGDILTPQQGDSEGIEARTLSKASIGDEIRIYDTGAYCASMRAKGYNAFPDATEVLVD